MTKEKKKENFITSFLWILLLALIFRSFFFTSYNIPTGSMINTLKIGDYIFA
ncbi:MAG: S26 family signal peptidase, partial [Pseudomonadota bacterium]|nr:S26 family signal peptidase [Pseudomonadota bacterium]